MLARENVPAQILLTGSQVAYAAPDKPVEFALDPVEAHNQQRFWNQGRQAATAHHEKALASRSPVGTEPVPARERKYKIKAKEPG